METKPMPERPLLILPFPGDPIARRKKGRGRDNLHRPSRERQAQRLNPLFEELQRALDARRVKLQAEAQGVVPEEVVVLETVGTIQEFIRAVEKIRGMEWLSEVEEEEIPPDDDFFALDDKSNRTDKPLRGRMFMVFTNQNALRQMLSLWASWKRGEKLPHGFGKWKALFERLRDVRSWGLRDRLLETGVLDDWQERADQGEEVVPCEIELWFRQSPEQRRSTRERVTALVAAQGGEALREVVLEEIAYHALLVRIPIGAIRHLLESAYGDAELVQCEQIQFFRATGQMTAVRPDDERQTDESALDTTEPVGRPVIALLDGLPLQAHRKLEGRLIVDDPDGFESGYPASERRHGTSMASLILHGDLATDGPTLSRPLYVRPIFQPDSRSWMRPRHETVPESTLVVDLLHRAVRRLFEGEGDEPPVAPDVAVINLSIGIRDRLFDGSMSPLARLLDWLAWKHDVLFVVSSGNHTHRIELDCTREELSALAPGELQNKVIRSLAADARHRRLLSPAEGVNALTVGALDEDVSSTAPPPQWHSPFTDRGLPSPINAQGMGYRRAIKPDILAPGGRVVVQECLGTASQASLNIYDRTLPPGQLVAAPGPTAGDRNSTWYTRGTSNATALASRSAALIYDVLEELQDLPGGELVEAVPRAVWLKALLAHGAEWGEAGSVLNGIFNAYSNDRQFKEYLTRLLGYGSIQIERVQECTAYRATALSCGLLSCDQSHIHAFPLPPSLSGEIGNRRLTITLAWLTPVNPRHQSWRRADLWFTPLKGPLRVGRQQADWRAVQRGTLQHEILEGADAVVFADNASVEIQVSCRADAGALEEPIPYALVTTLEVPEEVGVPIYEEVRARVQARVRVSTSPA
jgi:hypothetical protein